MPHEHPQSTPRDPSLLLLAILCCNVYKESFATANNLECCITPSYANEVLSAQTKGFSEVSIFVVFAECLTLPSP